MVFMSLVELQFYLKYTSTAVFPSKFCETFQKQPFYRTLLNSGHKIMKLKNKYTERYVECVNPF